MPSDGFCRSLLLLLFLLHELRAPTVGLQVRVRLDRLWRCRDFLDEAIGTNLTNANGLGNVLVLTVDLDRALRCGILKTLERFLHLGDIGRASLVGSHGPELDTDVGGLCRVTGHAV